MIFLRLHGYQVILAPKPPCAFHWWLEGDGEKKFLSSQVWLQPMLLINDFLWETQLQKPISFSVLMINPCLIIRYFETAGIKCKSFKFDEEMNFSSKKRLFSYMTDFSGLNIMLSKRNESTAVIPARTTDSFLFGGEFPISMCFHLQWMIVLCKWLFFHLLTLCSGY